MSIFFIHLALRACKILDLVKRWAEPERSQTEISVKKKPLIRAGTILNKPLNPILSYHKLTKKF